MPDLRTRFRGADQIPAPDLWADIEHREPRPARSGLAGPRRLAVVAFALALGVAATTFAVRALSGVGIEPQPASTITNGRIAFSAFDGTSWQIYSVEPDGSQLAQLTHVTNEVAEDPAWSPDGTQIAFVLDENGGNGPPNMWVMNADGSDPRQLTAGPGSSWSPAWSPDGTRIAFAHGEPANLYLVNADGTHLTAVTTGDLGAEDPSWSPDGSRIVFGEEGDVKHLYEVNAAGTGLVSLVDLEGWQNEPAWSPDGSTIAFTGSDTRGGGFGIYAVHPDGTDLRKLSNQPAAQSAAWSPDGSQIVFTASRPGSTDDPTLYLMNADGAGVRELQGLPKGASFPSWQAVPVATSPTPPETTTPAPPTSSSNGLIAFGCGYHICTMSPDGTNVTDLTKPDDPSIVLAAYDPVWSPDGTKIVFYGYPRGAVHGGANYDVYMMNADGSGVTNLTTSPADVASWFSQLDPKWSPDGTKIAYGGDDGLYVMNANGSDQTKVAAGQDASWSPDESRIAFEGAGGAIWSVAPDGSGLAQLTSGVGFDGFPAFSPNGTKIAYYHGQGSDRAIFVMNADGSDQTRVADFQADTMGRPVWSPDGSRLAFDLYYTDQTWDIYVVNADGTELADVANDPNMDENDPVWSPDGSTIAFQASHVLARDIDNTGTFDIYVMDPDGTEQIALTHDLGTSGGSDIHWQRLGTDQAP